MSLLPRPTPVLAFSRYCACRRVTFSSSALAQFVALAARHASRPASGRFRHPAVGDSGVTAPWLQTRRSDGIPVRLQTEGSAHSCEVQFPAWRETVRGNPPRQVGPGCAQMILHPTGSSRPAGTVFAARAAEAERTDPEIRQSPGRPVAVLRRRPARIPHRAGPLSTARGASSSSRSRILSASVKLPA